MHLTLDFTDARIGFTSPPRQTPRPPRPRLDAPAAGQVALTITRAEAEHALMSLARLHAAEWNVRVQSLTLHWNAPTPRSLSVAVTARAARAFVGATLEVSARAELTDTLDLTLHDLTAAGEGIIGNLLAPALRARLRREEGRRIPLGAKLPPFLDVGEARLRTTADELTIAAAVTVHDPNLGLPASSGCQTDTSGRGAEPPRQADASPGSAGGGVGSA